MKAYVVCMPSLKHEIMIVEFELSDKQHLLFQALLQGEDGLAFVRCVDGVQQLWTTAVQLGEVKVWLKSLPEPFNVRILREYIWKGEGDT